MRKFLLFTIVAVLGLASVGCTSDDNKSSSKFDKDIQGLWKESRVLFLDKNLKVIDEDEAYDEGCGLNEIEFKGSTLIVRSFFETMEGCDKEEEEKKYYIKGDYLYDKETGESNKIIELTANKLVILADFESLDYDIEIFEVHLEYVR